MDKRNKLRINTPDASLNLSVDDTIVLPPKITSDHIEIEVNPLQINSSWLKNAISKIFQFFYKHFLNCILLAIILILLNKPSDYYDLLQEIHSLRIKEVKPIQKANYQNICLISNAVDIKTLSEPYRFGFLKSNITDPYNMLEANNHCFSLQGESGSFEITFQKEIFIDKIGIYHPKFSNPKSGIKNFSIKIEEDVFFFEFNGIGYQEFIINRISNKIYFNIENNHGEKRYTSIYRVFVIGE